MPGKPAQRGTVDKALAAEAVAIGNLAELVSEIIIQGKQMRFSSVTAILILLVVAFSSGCNGRSVNVRRVNFAHSVLAIDQKFGKEITWDALFYYKEFTDIYENSDVYLPDAFLLLANAKYSEGQKKVCICAMQRAGLVNYVKIVDRCKELYDAGEISESLLNWAIAPNFSKAQPIVRNYDEWIVRGVLYGVLSDNKVSKGLKDEVMTILSGEARGNISDDYIPR